MSLTVRLRSESDFFRVKCVISCWWPCLSFQSLCVIASLLAKQTAEDHFTASKFHLRIFSRLEDGSACTTFCTRLLHSRFFLWVRHRFSPHIHRREETALKRLHQMRWIYICTYWGVYYTEWTKVLRKLLFFLIYILEICIIRLAQFAPRNFKLEQNSQGGTAAHPAKETCSRAKDSQGEYPSADNKTT
jgi:hypothetical protein